MKKLISMPMTAGTLAEYPSTRSLEAACRHFDCDGLEVIWGGEDLPENIPEHLHVGYHLTFFPDWLDFWRADRRALTRKFGSATAWTSFYGGPEGPDALLKLYSEDLDRAVQWGAEYVVFHVSDVSVEEGYTYRWEHNHQEVVDAALEVINTLLSGRNLTLAFLVENQWWPGFTFTMPALTRRLLDGIQYENKGIMLDTGHLMNANLELRTQEEGADWVSRMLEEHGGLGSMVRGIHLHQSLSGAYVKAHTGSLPDPWPVDYAEQFCQSQLLGPAAGEAGPEDALRFLQSCDLKTDRLAHPGENGDLPGGALCNAQRGLLPGEKAGKRPYGHQQVVGPVAELGNPLQHRLLLHGPAEAVAGGAGGLVFRCM